ncbi:uncharacterized protein N7498_007308 [Penicillium cinerascens]|uniref:Altered inheritance of mitochondria protein 11 n=1 Tax=Penicillium cinerascens TaxID=70096 RepID=A0A9W9MCM6_9EURO|nr:uncharacterized protein N7498_007308 [Penicillium cinerascens]KAJ5198191.1 hypothetical protein N7498_007308 [Penicillium cinerascens]
MLSFFGWGSSSKFEPNAPSPQETTASNQSQSPSSPASSTSAPSQPSTQSAQQTTPKDYTGLKLFIGGIAFSTFSVFITRRASIRKRIACIPPFYTSSLFHQPNANGAMEAFEALNLATINVLSFGMLTIGASMYALDVNGIEDMRKIMRGGLEGAAQGKSDEELENDVQEWVASVLGNRFEKQLEKERAKKRDAPNDKET